MTGVLPSLLVVVEQIVTRVTDLYADSNPVPRTDIDARSSQLRNLIRNRDHRSGPVATLVGTRMCDAIVAVSNPTVRHSVNNLEYVIKKSFLFLCICIFQYFEEAYSSS